MPADFDISPVFQAPPAGQAPQQPPSQPAPTGPFTPPSGPATPTPIMPKASKSGRILKWLILVAVGLFVVTIASLWWGGSSFSASGVVLTLQAPDRATSGDEITYAVNFRNDTKVPLTDLSFRLFYPSDSIVMKDGQATTPESEGFTVDRLDPGQSDKREFKIYMVGDKAAIKTARVHLIFKAGTLKSSFEKDASVSTTIFAQPVALTLVAPPSTTSGQPIQYILDARNETTEDLTDLKVVFKYPDGFTVQTMQPQPDEGNTGWKLAKLKAGSGTRITVNGVLNGNEQETKTVAVSLQRNINGQYVDYVRTDAFTTISSPLLSVTLKPNGSRDYVAFAGDTLRYKVAYANNSRYSFIGLTLSVLLEGDMYDTGQLRVQEGFYNESTRTVTYDSSGVPDLANLRPGQSGVVEFSVPLKPGFSGGAGGAKSFFVKATARLSTDNVPTGLDGATVFATDSVITKISSQPSLIENLLYDDDAGSGPMPPKVGETTTLAVQWLLTNPGNDVRDAKVIATLPPGITFKEGATSTGGSIPTFSQINNQVTWKIGTLPFGTGSGTSKYEGKFQISFTPSSNQADQSVALINGVTLTGTDSFTGQALQVRLKDLTSESVEGHTSEGRVQ